MRLEIAPLSTGPWGSVPPEDPNITLRALQIDVAAINVAVSETSKRVERIDDALDDLRQQRVEIVETRGLVASNERRISALEDRAERLEDDVDELSDHDGRIGILEKVMFGVFGSALLTAIGYLAAKFEVTLLH